MQKTGITKALKVSINTRLFTYFEPVQEGIEYYKKQVFFLQRENAESKAQINYLQAQIDQLKRMIFGAKSERFIPQQIPGQMMMELGAEAAIESIIDQTITVEPHERKAKKADIKPVRSALPANLPRIETVIEPEGDLTDCKKIGEEITEILELEMPKLIVQRIVRPKYLSADGNAILIGELPSRPIDKGMAGPKLLSHVIVSKYVDHLPVYRQVKQFKRWGIELPDSTIYGWITGTCKLLEPLYECLKKQVLISHYLQADESPLQVMTEEKKGSTHRGYMWVYHSPPERLVLFDYRKGRDKEGPKELLKDYKGLLQTDGYAVYDMFDNNPDITLASCMAHARRYFEQALDNDRQIAEYMMQRFGQLYDLETELKETQIDGEEKIKQRQQKAIPVLEEMERFMKEKIQSVIPKSPIGKAIAYTLPRWKKLSAYTKYAELHIDNNLVENQIRPLALGRKNYLFAGNHEGAQRSAMLYSLIGSCKLNGINPQEWLTDVLSKLPDTKLSDLYKLLPNYRENSFGL